MTFLHPTLAFAGLACVGIPILIHLLMRRKRKPVRWAAMRFLLEAYRQQRRRLKLEQFLLLASRCLLVALLAMLIARPVFGGEDGAAAGPRTLYILLDNSMAASARTDGDTAFDSLRSHADRLLAQLDISRGDRAGLITLAGPAEGIVLPAAPDIAAVRRAVAEVQPTDAAADLPGAVSLVAARLDALSGPSTSVAIVSEFRLGSVDASAVNEAATPSVGTSVRWLARSPATTDISNVSITDIEPINAVLLSGESGSRAQARVKLRRSGPAVASAGATTVSLRVLAPAMTPGDTGRAVANWTPGQAEQTVTVEAPLPAGAAEGVVLSANIDQDAIAGDNVRRRPMPLRRGLAVGILAPRSEIGSGAVDQFRAADWLRLALEPERITLDGTRTPAIRTSIVDAGALDARSLAEFDALLVASPELPTDAGWRAIAEFARAGRLVIVFPPSETNVHVWTDAMQSALGLEWTFAREARDHDPAITISAQRPVLSGADPLTQVAADIAALAPSVQLRRTLPFTPQKADPLLLASDGSTLLATVPVPNGRGMFAFMATTPELIWTDLPTKPLMVPLMQELVRQGVGRSQGAASTLAGSPLFAPAGSTLLRSVPVEDTLPGAPTDPVTVDGTGKAAHPIRHAGIWRAEDARGGARGLVAVDADPSAGRTETQSEREVAAYLAALSGQPVRMFSGADQPERSVAANADGRAGSSWLLPLAIAALALGLVEMTLGRWFSHAGGGS